MISTRTIFFKFQYNQRRLSHKIFSIRRSGAIDVLMVPTQESIKCKCQCSWKSYPLCFFFYQINYISHRYTYIAKVKVNNLHLKGFKKANTYSVRNLSLITVCMHLFMNHSIKAKRSYVDDLKKCQRPKWDSIVILLTSVLLITNIDLGAYRSYHR